MMKSFFQNDNASCHKAKGIIKVFIQERYVKKDDWSANSSDLNPICVWKLKKIFHEKDPKKIYQQPFRKVGTILIN